MLDRYLSSLQHNIPRSFCLILVLWNLILLLEVWKSVNVDGYPIRLDPYNSHLSLSGHSLRDKRNRTFNDGARLHMAETSFNVDAAKVWNAAPIQVTSAINIAQAKREIRKFVTSLPV